MNENRERVVNGVCKKHEPNRRTETGTVIFEDNIKKKKERKKKRSCVHNERLKNTREQYINTIREGNTFGSYIAIHICYKKIVCSKCLWKAERHEKSVPSRLREGCVLIFIYDNIGRFLCIRSQAPL